MCGVRCAWSGLVVVKVGLVCLPQTSPAGQQYNVSGLGCVFGQGQLFRPNQFTAKLFQRHSLTLHITERTLRKNY